VIWPPDRRSVRRGIGLEARVGWERDDRGRESWERRLEPTPWRGWEQDAPRELERMRACEEEGRRV